jgi:hypothetical protein
MIPNFERMVGNESIIISIKRLLQCKICFKADTANVYSSQLCHTGTYCADCLAKQNCTQCREKKDEIDPQLLPLLEQVYFKCGNSRYGCTQIVQFSYIRQHEVLCPYTNMKKPFSNNSFDRNILDAPSFVPKKNPFLSQLSEFCSPSAKAGFPIEQLLKRVEDLEKYNKEHCLEFNFIRQEMDAINKASQNQVNENIKEFINSTPLI